MYKALILNFFDRWELNRRVKVSLNSWTTADHGIAGQDNTLLHLYVFVEASSCFYYAISVDDYVVADERVDDSAVVMDLCIIPDYAPLDGHILSDRAISSNHWLFYNAVFFHLRVLSNYAGIWDTACDVTSYVLCNILVKGRLDVDHPV